MSEKESITHFIIHRMTEESHEEQSNAPKVLSCGGMYLSRPRNSASLKRLEYNVLNLANQKEPVKICTGKRWANPLYEMLHKEVLN